MANNYLKEELEHKLELIRIHKRRINQISSRIERLRDNCPLNYFDDLEHHQEKIAIEFGNCVGLIDTFFENKIPEPIIGKLIDISKGSIKGNNIFIGIALLENLIGKELTAEKLSVLNKAFGSIVIQNCKNVIIGSNFRAGGDFSIGDKG